MLAWNSLRQSDNLICDLEPRLDYERLASRVIGEMLVSVPKPELRYQMARLCHVSGHLNSLVPTRIPSPPPSLLGQPTPPEMCCQYPSCSRRHLLCMLTSRRRRLVAATVVSLSSSDVSPSLARLCGLLLLPPQQQEVSFFAARSPPLSSETVSFLPAHRKDRTARAVISPPALSPARGTGRIKNQCT